MYDVCVPHKSIVVTDFKALLRWSKGWQLIITPFGRFCTLVGVYYERVFLLLCSSMWIYGTYGLGLHVCSLFFSENMPRQSAHLIRAISLIPCRITCPLAHFCNSKTMKIRINCSVHLSDNLHDKLKSKEMKLQVNDTCFLFQEYFGQEVCFKA